MIDSDMLGGFGDGQTDRLTINQKQTLKVVELFLRLKNKSCKLKH